MKPQAQKPKKSYPAYRRKPSTALWLVIVGLFILAMVVLGLIIFRPVSRNQAEANCKSAVQSAGSLLKQKQYKQAYSQLKSAHSLCERVSIDNLNDTKNPSKFNGYADLFAYKAELARVAYSAGDKFKAKAYANEALEINKVMPDSVRYKLPNQAENYYDMSDIQDGVYNPYINQGATP